MNTFPLTPVDHLFTGIASQPITFAFSYRQKLDPVSLQKSLDATLEHFPILKSQLQRTSECDFEYHLSSTGLTFEIHESNTDFKTTDKIEQYITPVNSIEGQPLTKITLTQTPNGSVLAVSISHALVDGFSYFHFLSSWARICRGERILPPHIPRDVLASTQRLSKPISASDIYSNCGLFLGDRRTDLPANQVHIEKLFLSDETLSSWLSEAGETHQIAFSKNDVITAFLWKKYLPQWIKENDNPTTYFTCPFDFRRVKTGFPKNYFGCALCFATAEIDLHGLLKASLGDLAALIKEAVGKIKDDYISNSLNTLEGLRQQQGMAAIEKIHLRHPQHGMIVTNLTRLPIRDMNFGTGAPFNFLAFVDVINSAAILPAEGGVEVMVTYHA